MLCFEHFVQGGRSGGLAEAGRLLGACHEVGMPRHQLAIFIHGCFWHRHPGCSRASTPRTRRAFWLAKFSRNVERDVVVRKTLESLGWRVLIVWECETRRPEVLEALLTAALASHAECGSSADACLSPLPLTIRPEQDPRG
ncbi:hypothetical protein GU700_19135 [Methylobacterium sp. NI91]|nr:hypothetical protein CLZ_19130 [Methylobacterium sp. CLZ]QIJ82700.1 hypothetical protein GU700_19135 [Methylobacterium sp. NI91]